ncbi:MAG: sigma-70 family RNA polymerase sigma factor [Armatimonadota bacterium]
MQTTSPPVTSAPSRTSRSEEELIEAAKAGDNTAFDNLVRQYQDYLYRLMVRACHHPQDAEEVAGEAFARAYERLCQFEGRSSFVTWLSRIATNLCFRRREKAEIPAVSLDELGEDTPGHPDRTPATENSGPEAHLIQSEVKQLIYAALAKIPEPDQTVLRLRDIEELSANEVSEKTGLTVSAVKSRLHRARKALREQLNQYFQIENV